MVKRGATLAVLLLALAGCGADPAPDDLRQLARPSSPNNYLVCAPGLCAATADEQGIATDLPPDRALAAARRVAAAQPSTTAAGEDAGIGQLVYVQRTAWLRFPDIVRIQAIKGTDGRTTLALYSQSLYGYYDFGANKSRAQTWLKAIQAELAKS